MPSRVCCLLLLLLVLVWDSSAQLKKRKEVSIGYNLNYNPWKLAINKGLFEKVTGYTIKWTEIKDTYKAVVAMANDEVQMVVANSLDIGRAFSRGLECRLIWVVEDLMNAEALLVHNHYHAIWGAQYGGTVMTPLDLRGKTIAVWFGSTMHYALHTFYTEMNVEIVESTVYQRLGCRVDATRGLLEPCFYKPHPNAVLFLSLMPDDIGTEWGIDVTQVGSSHRRLLAPAVGGGAQATYAGKCNHYPDIATCYPQTYQAAYVGFPLFYEFKKTGTVLTTSKALSRWDKVTFTGLLAATEFLYELNPKYATYNVANFIKIFIDEMAKSNYYYVNNTKEFELTFAGKNAVAYRVASVIGGNPELVAKHLEMFSYPTMEQQVTCEWLGCGNKSRYAWALKDQSNFLKTKVKADQNQVPQIHGSQIVDIEEYQLAETIEDYSKFIDISFIHANLNSGNNGSYYLIAGDQIYLGYQITANYGRTTSLIIT